ncbi:MAG: dihydropteroate synthase [Clostridiaceae bacterium]|nr:dihydropteroate synthase [Clostridiaceae bacterium]
MGNFTKNKFKNLLDKDFVILDGASGTEFQKRGLKPGEAPELLNFSRPDWVIDTHKAYLSSGSDIILTNTFGASYHKLKSSDLTPEQVIPQAIKLAKKAVAEYQADVKQQEPDSTELDDSLSENKKSQIEPLVAFDCGPLGALIEPNGSMSFEQAYQDFAGQINLAKESDADLIMFETMSDLYELKIALLAAKENSDLPIICSMSFEANGRTFSGTDIASYVTLAQSLGADVIGLNCSTGPKQLLPLIKEILQFSKAPVLLKPNAGLPDPQTGLYNLPIDEFVESMREAATLGVKFLGGCCGTNSEYIKALNDDISDLKFQRPEIKQDPMVCSSTKAVQIGTQPLFVGEQLNPTGKKILKQALSDKNYEAYQKMAILQEIAGADILDVNCGLPGIDEAAAMAEVVKKIQAVSRLPLQIDSNKPDVLEVGLRLANGRSIINSMNGKAESMAEVIPLAKKYGSMVIVLPLDEQGIPKTAEQRIVVLEKIIKQCEKEGLPKENLIADCLVLTAAAEPTGGIECLRTIRLVKEKLGILTIIGLSNISFGLPARRQLNQVFYAEALANGLDLAILNPEHEEIVATRAGHMALFGQDPNQTNYLAYVEEKGDIISGYQKTTKTSTAATETEKTATEAVVVPAPAEAQSLEQVIIKGLENEAAQLAKQALQTEMNPLDIIQDQIIPALDEVGRLYQEGITFLPQLLQSSKAAQSALNPIRKAIEAQAQTADSVHNELKSAKEIPASKPIIVLATVEGDIHDIGKNIVKTVLENYDYTIRDLGNDVPPARILEAVKAENVKLVGLSALMTSTLPAMEATIKLLNPEQPDCKIMVGGAVLTEDYAKSIGADYYCQNANSSVEVAKEVFRNET